MRVVFTVNLDLNRGNQLIERARVGELREVSPQTAVFLIATGWARCESRVRDRRTRAWPRPVRDRRNIFDRRLAS
jgi:hypothetical protein